MVEMFWHSGDVSALWRCSSMVEMIWHGEDIPAPDIVAQGVVAQNFLA